MSFDVIEVICNMEYSDVADDIFKKGGFTLKTGDLALINGTSPYIKGENKFLFLNKRRYKEFGKLTITKVK